MTGTGIKGRGQETQDAVLAAVLGVLTATIDGWLLSSFRNGAQAANRQRDAVNSALVLVTLVLFAALLGSLAAGRKSTPQRRWRCAMLGSLLGHLALPAIVVVMLIIHPPTIPW
ncbi:hypothetical protein [Kitasatospora sp. NPDC085464]|uniref:hypothetical protein n=1 Tax=Kitasatospora sp. NPDC085464 TaxID=3364063 RepID=UPI0037CAE997